MGRIWSARAIALAVASIMISVGCDDDDIDVLTPDDGIVDDGDDDGDTGIAAACFNRVDLVSDQPDVAERTDPALVNAWGITPALGAFWIANAGTGQVSVIDATGAPARNAPAVPLELGAGITGVATNDSPAFVISGPSGAAPASVIVASETGALFAVNFAVDPDHADVVADRASVDANYKGVAILSSRDWMYILAADFHNGRIDVFDGSFALSTRIAFVDPTIPAGFAPFNVAVIGGEVYVAYAQTDAAREDEVTGPGLGYVTKFDSLGARIWTLSSPLLNAPWGMALAPASPGIPANTLFVGNFGDGRITVVDPASGREFGQLHSLDGAALAVDGLWGITFGDAVSAADPNAVYFAAGPDDEAHGLYGALVPCQ